MAPALLEDFQDSGYHFVAKTTPSKRPTVSPTPLGGPVTNPFTPPPSRFEPRCHPLEKQITKEVDGFFLTHWPFKTEKDRKKFVAAGFSRVTCLYFPLAKDDRIHFACRLLTILFLIDGEFIL